jgi:hypothetical protein
MSISGITGNASTWHWQQQAGGKASSSAAASGATESIANTGSVSAGNMAAFYQSFSADLRSMMTQSGQGASATTTEHTSQTAANQPMAAPHHHHHHHPSQGGGGSLSTDANQLTSEIGQSLTNGSLTPSGISNASGLFASDVMQAMQAYGSSAATTPATGLVV